MRLYMRNDDINFVKKPFRSGHTCIEIATAAYIDFDKTKMSTINDVVIKNELKEKKHIIKDIVEMLFHMTQLRNHSMDV